MYQRDYILRIIEQLGRALVQLRQRILAEELSRADMQSELQTVASQAGLNLELLRSVDSATLPIFVAPGGESDPTRCWLAAELLYLEVLSAREEGRTSELRREVLRAQELYAMLPEEWSPPEGSSGAAVRQIELQRWLVELEPSGAARPGDYHLHFEVGTTPDPEQYLDGTPTNPYPLLGGTPAPRHQ